MWHRFDYLDWLLTSWRGWIDLDVVWAVKIDLTMLRLTQLFVLEMLFWAVKIDFTCWDWLNSSCSCFVSTRFGRDWLDRLRLTQLRLRIFLESDSALGSRLTRQVEIDSTIWVGRIGFFDYVSLRDPFWSQERSLWSWRFRSPRADPSWGLEISFPVF